MAHVEITKEQMERAKRCSMHCDLMFAGWDYSESEEGTERYYSNPNAFDADKLCLEDAYKLYKMVKAWGEQNDQ